VICTVQPVAVSSFDLNVAHYTRLDQHLQLGNLHPSSLVD
jgi:hypothetical protein